MRKSLLVVPVLALAAMVFAASPASAKDNWIGMWHLDPAASKFSPGPALKSQMLMFEEGKDGIHLSSETVHADGKEDQGSYVSKFDGSDVAWTGNPDADTASPKRIDANTYENVWKKGGKATVRSKVVVAADGNTLTIHQTGTNAEGKKVENVLVFHKM